MSEARSARWAEVNVVGLIGDDGTTFKLLRTSGKSPLWVWPIRKIDVVLTATRDADSVLSGALVELNGRRQVLPLGRIWLDCTEQGEDDNSWKVTFADDLPGPRCIIYRPAVRMVRSSASATVLGPMMQFLIGAPLPVPAQRALLGTKP